MGQFQRKNAPGLGRTIFRLSKRAIKALLLLLGIKHIGRITLSPRPPRIEPVPVSGGPLLAHHLLIDTNSANPALREMASGEYDSFFFAALRQAKDLRGATIWDVGAHFGYHSLCFSALVGHEGHIVAFEPNPFNVDRFQKNMDLNPDIAGNVTLMTCALSDTDGEAKFFLSPDVDSGTSSGSHLGDAVLPEDPGVYQRANFVERKVIVARADTLLRENRAPAPDILKIDVEGAELKVLEGAAQLLSAQRPLLLIEVHNITMMFYVQKFLLEAAYETSILGHEHSTLSRCFIMAKPKAG